MKIIDRYIMMEMIGPFLFGACAFTLLFFSAETLMGVAKMILESQAGIGMVVKYLFNRLPYVLIMTFPMSSLLAALMAYGRLSGDSEIVALKAGGVGFLRIFMPGLLFCLFISLISLAINQYWVPPATKQAYSMVLKLEAPDQIERALITSPRLLSNGDEQLVYAHVLNVREQRMKGVYMHMFRREHRIRELYAQEARWNDKLNVWEVLNIEARDFDPNTGEERYAAKGKNGWTVMDKGESPASPDQLAKRKLRPEEMTAQELSSYLNSLPPIEKTNPDEYRKRNKYKVMYHQKVSLPMTCLVFGAFAIPLGLRPQRTSTSIGFGLSLFFILLYYVLMTIGMMLGENGTAPPWVAAWLPNIVFALVGTGLVLDATRK
ncbi:MAG: LptF/LptG family permease [bacterium]|nr:LptF/LptG family permease [bacterium]